MLIAQALAADRGKNAAVVALEFVAFDATTASRCLRRITLMSILSSTLLVVEESTFVDVMYMYFFKYMYVTCLGVPLLFFYCPSNF